MRIMGFSYKDWVNHLTGKPKLEEDKFTTFRFQRRDKDWHVGEVVQVVYKPRRKGGGEKLGVAKIIGKELRGIAPEWRDSSVPMISNEEAKRDGFENWESCLFWMAGTHGVTRLVLEPMNKLTLRWVAK